MKQILIAIIILLLNIGRPIFAQTILKSADLLADFEIARKCYEQMNPGLCKYKTKASIDEAI